jgi:nicotinate-nucleotide pyrophosphorylase (carboxylating)
MPTLPDRGDIEALVERALAEDVGPGDVTAALVPAGKRIGARVIAREAAVVCGRAWFDAVFARLDADIAIDWRVEDGAQVEAGSVPCTLQGPARSILTGERTALNLLQTLSGTATQAARFVDRLAGTHTRVLDTRKTLPGLRSAQKYAVRCGGGENHRMGLFDAVLIKENHVRAAGGIGPAIEAARRGAPGLPMVVEVERLDQLEEALSGKPDRLLLDNFSLDELREAVRVTAGRAALEASGNLDLDSVRAVAETGVDYVSVGAITKHLRAIDFSMQFLGTGTRT